MKAYDDISCSFYSTGSEWGQIVCNSTMYSNITIGKKYLSRK